jgi:hypothetical protein
MKQEGDTARQRRFGGGPRDQAAVALADASRRWSSLMAVESIRFGAGGGGRHRAAARGDGLCGLRSDAAGGPRRDVYRHALWSRDCARSDDGQGDMELQAWRPASPRRAGWNIFRAISRRRRLIVVGTSDAKLFTLDPKTGALNKAFGVDGFVDLNTPEITHNLPGERRLSSPPTMYENLIILGGKTTEKRRPWAGGRCARLRHPHRQAGLDLPLHSAARRAELRRLGGR